MNKLVKVLLVVFVIVFVAYGIYFIRGRPPIPLLKYEYNAIQGSLLYDIVKETESDQITLSWATNGEVEALADGKQLAKINYNMSSFGYTLDVASRFLPEEKSTFINKFSLRVFPRMIGGFFYHILRIRVTFIIYAA